MKKLIVATVVALLAVPVMAGDDVTSQSHAWGSYHWSRSGAEITPPIHDNVNSVWDSYLDRSISDWNQSRYINSAQVESALSTAKRCTSATGKIEVCNAAYGQNGWLGIAGISLSGGHIIKGYTKLNDTYFAMAKYNTYSWRMMVACQEVGHNFGLGHVNETFTDTNTGSCMDYTNDPSGKAGTNGSLANEHPNSHDYSMLESIYSHTHAAAAPGIDSAVSAFAERTMSVEELLAGADQWGAPMHYDGNGRPDVFAMHTGSDEHGNDRVEITHVLWAPEGPLSDRNGLNLPRTRD
jgi:hypothetical protein